MTKNEGSAAASVMPPANRSGGEPSYAGYLKVFVFALFFAFGGLTSLNDVLIPKLKSLFTLSYGQVMLVQSAFFAAYFLFSIPAAKVVDWIGYQNTMVGGLLTMSAGAFLFMPAASLTSRTGTTWSIGAPRRLGSVENEYCVLAMQTGRLP